MQLSIRKADATDCMNVFKLSNEPVVRENAINCEAIKLEDHIIWYDEKINSDMCEFYIVENENNEFIGQVRFDGVESEAFITVSLRPEFRGKSLGVDVIMLATKETMFSCIYSKIRKNNLASLKSFLKAGYEQINCNEDFYTLVFIH